MRRCVGETSKRQFRRAIAPNPFRPRSRQSSSIGHTMTFITTKDGTQIYYNDWGTGQPVVFSHGWPLSADAFEDQMFFLASRGYRCISHDRRGHGRSGQPWPGNDMDTYADDLAELVAQIKVQNAIHIGHPTGGGEVARYIGRHGTRNVAKAVLIGAVPALMLKTEANRPRPILAACRSRFSTNCAARGRRIVPLSGVISACRSMATTRRTRKYRKACANRFGCTA
jgi:pimeloyl-ACP methyl ester carboxylesterase